MEQLGQVCQNYGGVDDSRFGKPMPLIGMYVALASLLCAIGMIGDLVLSYRRRRVWVPAKVFTFNAATVTILGVATKTSSDIGGSMPGLLDQLSKLTGVVLVCITMSHSMPSLSVMDDSTMLANLIAVGILVITLFVNMWIQILTGVITEFVIWSKVFSLFMLSNLILLFSRALMVSEAKKHLDRKYSVHNKRILDEIHGNHSVTARFSTMNVREYIAKYWLIVVSTSTQIALFGALDVVSAFTSATTGVLCTVLAGKHIYAERNWSCYMRTDYQWTIGLILFFQLVTILTGTVASIFRFTLATYHETTGIDAMIYRTRFLKDLMDAPLLSFHFRRKLTRKIVNAIKKASLFFLVVLQLTVTFFSMVVGYAIAVTMTSFLWIILDRVWSISLRKTERLMDEFGFCLENVASYMMLAKEGMVQEKEVKWWLRFPMKWIRKGQSHAPTALCSFIRENSVPSHGLKRIIKVLDAPTDDLSDKFPCCWSLTLVTLASIMQFISPDKETLSSMMGALQEGFRYMVLVDENFPLEGSTKLITAAEMVWDRIYLHGKWLDIDLKNDCSTTRKHVEIVDCLKRKAKRIVESHIMKFRTEYVLDWPLEVLAAQSLYNITSSILKTLEGSSADLPFNTGDTGLYFTLQGALSDVIVACLVNLPHAIIRNCSRGEFGDKQTKVREAAIVSGQAEEIIDWLQKECSQDKCPSAKMEHLDSWKEHRV